MTKTYRLKTLEVLDNFFNKIAGRNHNGNLVSPNGTLLFSYNDLIARHDEGSIVVLNPTNAPTQTTKKHINRLIETADTRLILVSEM